MNYYKIYGLYVSSDYEFPELFPIDRPSNINIYIKNTDLSHMFGGHYEENSIDDKFCHVCDYKDTAISYVFPCQGAFIIKNGDTIEYHLTDICSTIFVRHFILCFCFGALLRQRNILTLHGSGILYKGKMLSISGVSGSGKSTLADGLLRRGGRFLGDDAIALSQSKKDGADVFFANPTMPFRKLCEDALKKDDLNQLTKLNASERNKFAMPVAREAFYDIPTPLDAIIIIEKASVIEPVIIEITGVSKLPYIIKNLYQRKIYDNLGLKNELFSKCIALANTVPVFVIKRPLTGVTVTGQIELLENVLL